MYEIIAYSCVIILLPIIPAYILYTAIPDNTTPNVPGKPDTVEGKYQGLNIKLKGAFAGYFILVLLLTGFIGARLVAGSDYEHYTVEGIIDVNRVGDPSLITFSIEPPEQQKYPNGRFIIKNVPIHKGDEKSSTLILSKMFDGKRIDEVVNLEEGKKAYEKDKKYKIKFKKNNHISIDTPITFVTNHTQNNGIGGYSTSNAVMPVPINN